MKRTLAFGIAITSALLSVALSEARGGAPYRPLAWVEITAQEVELDGLVRELRTFANERNLTVKRGDFPKQGEWVLNLGLYFQTDSFFILNNFTQRDRLTLIAYSHEEERSWRMIWDDLLERIASELGNDRVRVITP